MECTPGAENFHVPTKEVSALARTFLSVSVEEFQERGFASRLRFAEILCFPDLDDDAVFIAAQNPDGTA